MPIPTYSIALGQTWNTITTPVWNLTTSPTWSLWTGIDDVAYWRSSNVLQTVRGQDRVQPVVPPRVGTAAFDVDNVSGVFNPSSNPLAAGAKIQVGAMYAGVPYSLWYGISDEPTQSPERGEQSVHIPLFGVMGLLTGKPPISSHKISTALYSNITTDQALTYIFQAAGVTQTLLFDVGKTTLLWWWVEDQDPWQAALAVLAAEGPTAQLYEDGQGRIVFKNRWAISTLTRCNTSQATLSDAVGAAVQMARPFSYDSGSKYIVNTVRWTTNVRSAKTLAAVWTGPTPITLVPNEVRIYAPNYTPGDPFTAAVAPVPGMDYTLTAGAVTPTLSRTSGQSVTLTLTAGAAGATLTGLQLRAQPVTVDSTTDIVNAVGAPLASGVSQQPLNTPMIADIAPTTVQGLADSYVGLWKSGRPIVNVTLINVSAAALVQQLSRELFDRVTVVEQMASISADYWIVAIAHEVTEGGSKIKTTFTCILANAAYGLWNSGLWGVYANNAYWGF